MFSPHSGRCVVKTLKGGLNPAVLAPEAPCSVLVWGTVPGAPACKVHPLHVTEFPGSGEVWRADVTHQRG